MYEKPQECIEFWRETRTKVDKFKKLDNRNLVFGANTRGIGHQYDVLPVVSNAEVADFENSHQLELPMQYKAYLQTFGAGGAGPDYGIADFRQSVSKGDYSVAFPYNEEVWYEDMDDDQPIWDYPGLASVGTAGCGTEYLIELRGPLPGRMWVDWQQACSITGTLVEHYQKWIDKVEPGLERFHRLLEMAEADDPLSFETVVERMQCEPRENRVEEDRDWIKAGETMVYFAGTVGGVILDSKRQIARYAIDNVGQIS